MKRVFSVITATAICLATAAAFALPPIPDMAAEHYAKQPNGEKIVAGMKLKAEMGKCSMCHLPGADKKARGHGLNDFGKAVHDNFKHKDYLAEVKIATDANTKDDAKAAAKAKAMTILVAALTKASELKNAEGKVYGDLIKAGTLPGKNPPAEAKPAEAKPAEAKK